MCSLHRPGSRARGKCPHHRGAYVQCRRQRLSRMSSDGTWDQPIRMEGVAQG